MHAESGRIRIEVCCGSADDVIEAFHAGADRVELNSDLFHGGLTPTVGSLRVAKRETGMPIMTMVRPREGGFCYTPAEFAVCREDARVLLENGADGLVFGFLHEDGTIDRERTRILAETALEAGKEAVFHRAIDVVPDWKRALDSLIRLGQWSLRGRMFVLSGYIVRQDIFKIKLPKFSETARIRQRFVSLVILLIHDCSPRFGYLCKKGT